MKTFILGAAAAAMALTGLSASAQPYQGRHDGGRYTAVQYRHDGRDRGGDRYDRNSHWREGQVFSGYRDHRRMISDWGRYHLPPPRAGYAYYYDDDGGVVMAALASGLIGLALGDALADPGYAAPYPYAYGYSPYAPPPAPYGYPYAPY